MRTRAYTLVELTIVVALSALIVGVVCSLFAFTSYRLSDAYNRTVLYDQVSAVADMMEHSIKNAITCSSKDGDETLVCRMPFNGVDTDGDGFKDHYYPSGVNPDGSAAYFGGNYSWYYSADSSGAYHSGSGFVWRAERAASTDPNGSDVDDKKSKYYGGGHRYPLVSELSVTVNASANSVTFTVTGSTMIGSLRSASTTEDSSNRVLALTRTVNWRH